MQSILTLDLHGKNRYQAKVAIDAALRRAKGVYRIRLIHGCHGGTALRDMIADEYSTRPGILRLAPVNDSITELILREL